MRNFLPAIALAVASCMPAQAVDLNVSHFGTALYGFPFAVAKEKGYFKEAGLDVTGFLTSAGGGTTVRNVLASELPLGEVALPAVIAAAQQGVNVKIIFGGTASAADQVWVTRKDDLSIKSIADLKGKKLGYSSPKSVTDVLSSSVLLKNNMLDQVERRPVGGVGSALAALREGGVDITYVTQPVWAKESGNYRRVFNSSDWEPKLMQTVGVVRTDFLEKNPDLIRRIIIARRKGVEYIAEHPDESAEIIAREYKIDASQARAAIGDIQGVKGSYWSHGEFDYDGMDVMLHGLQAVGAIKPGPFEWSKYVDDRYLPDDLRKGKS